MGRIKYYFLISGFLVGLASCAKYPMLILLVLGLFIPWRKMWLFFVPALGLIAYQIVSNIISGIGFLGDNWNMNVIRKGAGLSINAVKNLVMFPMTFSMEAWPDIEFVKTREI